MRRSSPRALSSPRARSRRRWKTSGPREGSWVDCGFRIVDFGLGGEELKRSEEHTSELQSRFDLVCRLLLEKKKSTRCWALPAQPLGDTAMTPTDSLSARTSEPHSCKLKSPKRPHGSLHWQVGAQPRADGGP